MEDSIIQSKQQCNTSKQQQSMLNTYPQKYFLKLLHINHKNLFNFQTSHIMVLYFIVQGLAANNSLHEIDKQSIIKYIKTLELQHGGFTSSSLYTGYNIHHQFNIPHIVFTYSGNSFIQCSAVNILKILGALNQINQQKCLNSVKQCFKQNGSFSNFLNSNQADLRFVYAALAICNSLQSFQGINKEKVKNYIDSCYNYDGGYGLRPYCQSHCGAIYCALASYILLGQKIPYETQTLQFLVNKQTTNEKDDLVGVQGRVGKLPDSCYTFWVGASIKIITDKSLLNEKIQFYLRLCYNQQGYNFSKYPNQKGDPLHTLHSSIGLKILFGKDKDINIIQGTVNC